MNAAWAWILISRGRKWRSPALEADGWHLTSDVITSAGVLLGLLLAMATGWYFLDPLLAATPHVQYQTFVTRNTKDVTPTGVPCLNPFKA
jgi:Co/Zn/Cd efflux system component